MPLGRTLSFIEPIKKPAISIAKLIEVLQGYNKVYPGCFIITNGNELNIHKVINNGGDSEYVAQIFFD